MDHSNAQRVFHEGRMAPWEPEHAVYIQKELAKMEIEQPGSSLGLKADYDKRMADYIAAQPVPEVPEVKVPTLETPPETPLEVVKPKRKYTKKAL